MCTALSIWDIKDRCVQLVLVKVDTLHAYACETSSESRESKPQGLCGCRMHVRSSV